MHWDDAYTYSISLFFFFSGAAFDVRDFHYAILNNGPVPLDVLDDIVTNWISTVQNSVQPEPIKCEPTETVSGAVTLISKTVWSTVILIFLSVMSS